MYCVYLTTYRGKKLPPFYIGYCGTNRIHEENYHGSVSSKRYQKIWKEELIANPHLFKTTIIQEYDNIAEAQLREIDLHTKLNVVKSPLYINMASGGRFTPLYGDDNPSRRPEVIEKIREKNKKQIPWSKGLKGIYSDDVRKSMGAPKKGKSYESAYGLTKAQKMKEGQSLAKKGRVWCNDGVRDYMVWPDQVPVGYKVGRIESPLKGRKFDSIGSRWFTNGKISKKYIPGEEPSEWYMGRSLKNSD